MRKGQNRLFLLHPASWRGRSPASLRRPTLDWSLGGRGSNVCRSGRSGGEDPFIEPAGRSPLRGGRGDGVRRLLQPSAMAAYAGPVGAADGGWAKHGACAKAGAPSALQCARMHGCGAGSTAPEALGRVLKLAGREAMARYQGPGSMLGEGRDSAQVLGCRLPRARPVAIPPPQSLSHLGPPDRRHSAWPHGGHNAAITTGPIAQCRRPASGYARLPCPVMWHLCTTSPY